MTRIHLIQKELKNDISKNIRLHQQMNMSLQYSKTDKITEQENMLKKKHR